MTILPLLLAVLVGAKHTDGGRGVPLPGCTNISCRVCYSASTLKFVFSGRDKPQGRFILQVRPGSRDLAAPVPPFYCEVENRVWGKVTNLLAPTAHTRETPHFTVRAETRQFDWGWDTSVKFPFRGRLNWWPMFKATKKNPLSWWATVRYIDAAGKVTDWGTPSDPLEIAWGAKPTIQEARDELFLDHDLVEDYRGMRAKYCDIYEYSQQEKWVGFIDPGVETFAWRQADSEKLFFDRYAFPIASQFDEAITLLEWGYNPVEKRRDKTPKSLKLHEPAQNRLFKMIDDINLVGEQFSIARRQYLSDRFMGRPLPEAKVKPKSKDSDSAAPALPFGSEEESSPSDDKDSISLDDDELQF